MFEYETTYMEFNSEGSDFIPGNLKQAIDWLTEKYNQIPEDLRDSTDLSIGHTSDDVTTIDISYRRKRTQEERQIALEQFSTSFSKGIENVARCIENAIKNNNQPSCIQFTPPVFSKVSLQRQKADPDD